jgi:predicted DsbA family dithiol-disulfide isomerase
MTRFLIHSDLACPFSYFLEASLEKMAVDWCFELSWAPFELHPQLPPEGMALTEMGRERLWVGALSLAGTLKVAFNPPALVVNTRRALGAVLAVAEEDPEVANALRTRIQRLYFVEGLNLSDPALVMEVCGDVVSGSLLERARSAAFEGSNDALVETHKAQALAAKVEVVPILRPFIGGVERLDRRVEGPQPVEILESFFIDLGVEREKPDEAI